MGAQRYHRRLATALVAVFLAALLPLGFGGAVAHASKGVGTRVDLQVRDIVFDPVRDVIYVSVNGGDPTYPNMVVTVDPDTHAVVGSRSLGADPDALAITPDGSALYVGLDADGAVKKFSLPGFEPGWSYTFGAPTVAADIEVRPGTVDTIAVSRRQIGSSPAWSGVVIIDSGVARPNTTAGHISNSIAFNATGTQLFGMDMETSAFTLTRFSVDTAGLAVTEEAGFDGGAIVYHGGRVYTSSGLVIDVQGDTMTLVDDLLPYSTLGGGAAVDAGSSTVYIVDQQVSLPKRISAFDLDTLAPFGFWTVTNASDSVAANLIALGHDRLAYIDGNPLPGRIGVLMLVDVSAPLLGSLGEYTPLTPQRILDTRDGLGRGGVVARVGPGETLDVDVTGVGGVPDSGVDSVVMNVTVVDPTASGYLTVFPTGIARPTISSLNFTPWRTVANLVTVPVGVGGRVSVYNPFGHVDVVFDIAGFYAAFEGPDGTRFNPLGPMRVMDTRDRPYVPDGPVGAIAGGQSVKLRLTKQTFGVTGPSEIRAVAINVTVTEPTEASYITVSPSDGARPVVSNLNFVAGDTLANQVIVRLPDDGVLDIYNHAGSAHVVVDLVGYYDNLETFDKGRFISVEPYRAVDTRIDSPFPPPGDLWHQDVLYIGDPNEQLSAYVMNVTVTNTIGSGYVTAYPFSQTAPHPPLASTLNYTSGRTVPNHAIVPTGPYVGFYNFGGRAQLVVDVFGGFM